MIKSYMAMSIIIIICSNWHVEVYNAFNSILSSKHLIDPIQYLHAKMHPSIPISFITEIHEPSRLDVI